MVQEMNHPPITSPASAREAGQAVPAGLPLFLLPDLKRLPGSTVKSVPGNCKLLPPRDLLHHSH